MRLDEITKLDGIEPVYIHDGSIEITKGYCCDLMSEVIGRAESGSIWITVHSNKNVLGVAVMIDLKAVIISEGYEVSEEVLAKAKEEGISILTCKEKSFIAAGRLYEAGIR